MDRPERSDKRAQILEAALKVFSQKGVYAARIADIAAEAGIAYGLVYHYFRNKEEVLSTIFEEQWARVTELLEDAARGSDTADRLRRVADVFLKAYRRRPEVVELLLLEFTRMSKFLEPDQIEHISRAYAVVTRIIDRGQSEGEIRKDASAHLLTLSFMGGLQQILQTQVLGAFHPPEDFEEQGARTMVDCFMNGVTVQ